MSRTRSPNYPAVDLGAAIGLIAPVFNKEKRNKMPREVLAQHLGYGGLNGRSLGIIGALRAFRLVEGSGDELRVSDDAIILLNAPDDDPDKIEAFRRCALAPSLFRDLAGRFESTPSEGVLKYNLIKMEFTPEAAEKASQSYLSTMAIAGNPQPTAGVERKPSAEGALIVPQNQSLESRTAPRSPMHFAGGDSDWVPSQRIDGPRREIITLDEGDVLISFPARLSATSLSDLKDHLDLLLRKMERRISSAAIEARGSAEE